MKPSSPVVFASLLSVLVTAAPCLTEAREMTKEGSPSDYTPVAQDVPLFVSAVQQAKPGSIQALESAFAVRQHGVAVSGRASVIAVGSPAVPAAPINTGTGAAPHLQGASSLGAQFSRRTAAESSWQPQAFSSLDNAVDFIRHQRANNGTGLPATFFVPSGTTLPSDRDLVIREGVGLYDTSLAVMALLDHGDLEDAGQILDIYASGYNGNFDLRAYPNGNNGGAFKPFDSQEAYYFFDFTRASGLWGPEWNQWTAHTGPNAWLIVALTRYIDAMRAKGVGDDKLKPYLKTAEAIGQGMLRMQTEEGGIRFAPKGTYFTPPASDPYLEVNSENNVSAFAAFNALAKVTGKQEYRKGADDILRWFKNTPDLYNAETGLLKMGAVYSEKEKAWKVQDVYATDSGGTWTLSSLGVNTIDGLWGDGAAMKMWQSTRARTGRTAERSEDGKITVRKATAEDRLDGLDFSELFPEDQGLISSEWTGGGIFALQQLVKSYEGSDKVSSEQLDAAKRDLESMKNFLAPGVNAYAVGQGNTTSREGKTGFGWFSPPENVSAMASIYSLFKDDPLAWSRSVAN